MNASLRILVPAALLSATLSGCAHKKAFSSGQVYRDWTERLSEMGILPVFPPREDIVVGDIYLLPMHPGANALAGHVGGLGFTGIRAGFLTDIDDWTGTNGSTVRPISEALNNYYTLRPSFPGTPPGFLVEHDSPTAVPMVPVPGLPNVPADDRTGVFDPQPILRLKQVAFPEFTVTTTSQVGLSALVPIEGFLAGAGLNSSQVEQVSVKIPQAESYGVSSDWLLSTFLKTLIRAGSGESAGRLFLLCTDQPDPAENGPAGDAALAIQNTAPLMSASGLLARAMFDQVLSTALNERIADPALRRRLYSQVVATRNDLYLTLISEVFYTRALDINVQFAAGTAAGASARPVTVDDLRELASVGSEAQGADAGGGNAVTVSNQAPTLELKSGEDAIELARRLRELNLGSTGVGGSIQVVSTGARNIGLRRIFAQPIAIGVRGSVLRISKQPVEFVEAGTGVRLRGFAIELDTLQPLRTDGSDGTDRAAAGGHRP